MNMTFPLESHEPENRRLHIAIVLTFVFGVTLAHWTTPRSDDLLIVHVALRKAYIVPVVLAAIWFDLRGAILTAGLETVLFTPHVVMQWRGDGAENINQAGEVVTIWVTAVLSGVFAKREKATLRKAASALHGTVQALVMALDIREHDTEQHSLRVRAYTLRLAKEMRIGRKQQHAFGLAALLHDIGKIGIPDAILLKPAGLSDDEWARMREHPELGARILAPVPFFREVVQIVQTHHERFDGTGYPQGLAGKDIPHGARVFAVADVFDALTSARPYKQPFTHEAARSTILEGSGKHFDPDVVEAFSRIPQREWDRLRGTVVHDDTEGA